MVRSQSSKNQLLIDFEVKPTIEQLMSPDEIFEVADEALLRNLSEDRRLERKSSRFSGSSLGEYICMWANTPPDGGLIVCGISDDEAIEGCKHLPTEKLNKIEQVPHVFCPDAQTEIKHIAVKNDNGESDFVLLFRVKYRPNNVVKTSSQDVFVRKGDSKIRLKPEEIRELQADKGEVSFELEDCKLTWPDDFDEKAIAEFVATLIKKRGLPESLTIEEVLVLRHLGRRIGDKFLPNYACLLLFAKDPLRLMPGCKIRFQRFESEHEETGDKYNAVKDLFLEGCVPDLIRQAEQVLDSQLRTFSPLDAKGKFFPVPEYPKPAWYEAVVNACVHRSYGNGMKNMTIFIKMFDDKLVVESPGPFPPFVTPQNIYDSSSHPRNPHLMDAMFYMEYVKCANEGAKRIRNTMKAMRLPEPEFNQNKSQSGSIMVRVTLRNNIKQRRAWIDRDVAKIVGEVIASGFGEKENRVVNWAAEHNQIKISDVMRLLDITWHSARNILFDLTKRKVLQYIRFREYEKNRRDSKAYFRLRSNDPLPEDAFEQTDLE
jgi:ATP-dependent DNA helicase RecG